MNRSRLRQTGRLLGLGLLTLLVVSACGFKSRPLPLEKPLPVAPPDLQARQLGNSMLVSWTIPETNQDGTPATDLAGFNLYRMIFDPLDDCPDCIDRSTLLRKIDLDYLLDVQVIDNRVYLFDRDVRPGKGYQYRIAARTAKSLEGDFAKVRRAAVPPPPSPAGLSATGHDRMIRLHWDGVIPDSTAATLLGYQLYRGPNGPVLPATVNADLLRATGYDDFGVENDQTYSYQVRSVVKRGDAIVESPPSATVSAIPSSGR